MPDLKEQLYPSWPAQVVAHPMVTSSDEDKFRYLQVLTLLIDADDVIPVSYTHLTLPTSDLV